MRRLISPIPLLLLTLFISLLVIQMRHDSPVYDEAVHLSSGYSYLRTGRYWIKPAQPPLARRRSAAAPRRPLPEAS